MEGPTRNFGRQRERARAEREGGEVSWLARARYAARGGPARAGRVTSSEAHDLLDPRRASDMRARRVAARARTEEGARVHTEKRWGAANAMTRYRARLTPIGNAGKRQRWGSGRSRIQIDVARSRTTTGRARGEERGRRRRWAAAAGARSVPVVVVAAAPAVGGATGTQTSAAQSDRASLTPSAPCTSMSAKIDVPR